MQFIMNDNKSKQLAYPLVLLILGLLLMVIPTDTLMDIVFTFLGIFLAVISLIPCMISFMQAKTNRKYLVPACIYFCSLVFGICIIFYHEFVMGLIFSIWLIVFPIFRIIIDPMKKERIKKEIPLILIGIVLLFIPTGAFFNVLIKICGGALMVLGVVYLILYFLKKDKNNDTPIDPKRGTIIDADCHDINDEA